MRRKMLVHDFETTKQYLEHAIVDAVPTPPQAQKTEFAINLGLR